VDASSSKLITGHNGLAEKRTAVEVISQERRGRRAASRLGKRLPFWNLARPQLLHGELDGR
jgi:hypothetical protein